MGESAKEKAERKRGFGVQPDGSYVSPTDKELARLFAETVKEINDEEPWSVPETDEVEGEDELEEADIEPELVVPHRPAKPVKPKKR